MSWRYYIFSFKAHKHIVPIQKEVRMSNQSVIRFLCVSFRLKYLTTSMMGKRPWWPGLDTILNSFLFWVNKTGLKGRGLFVPSTVYYNLPALFAHWNRYRLICCEKLPNMLLWPYLMMCVQRGKSSQPTDPSWRPEAAGRSGLQGLGGEIRSHARNRGVLEIRGEVGYTQ